MVLVCRMLIDELTEDVIPDYLSEFYVWIIRAKASIDSVRDNYYQKKAGISVYSGFTLECIFLFT